jgi:hypothetical protein
MKEPPMKYKHRERNNALEAFRDWVLKDAIPPTSVEHEFVEKLILFSF